jgi:hypothetical protein
MSRHKIQNNNDSLEPFMSMPFQAEALLKDSTLLSIKGARP